MIDRCDGGKPIKTMCFREFFKLFCRPLWAAQTANPDSEKISLGFTMRIIHWFLGLLILFIDWLTTPKSIQRPAEMQADVNEQSRSITLYQYKACPFCVKVRRSLKRLSLPIETLDAKRCDTAKQELLAGGGKLKVPCLKIEEGEGGTQWMYDSKDIIGYLEQRFAEA
ncbi:MAG: glutaredoxin [Polaribacter sp.]|jgi:glutaredoxin